MANYKSKYSGEQVDVLLSIVPELSNSATKMNEEIQNINTDMSDIRSNVNNKVDKQNGKGLSTEDYTTEEKEQLSNLGNRVKDIEEKEYINKYLTNFFKEIPEGKTINDLDDANEYGGAYLLGKDGDFSDRSKILYVSGGWYWTEEYGDLATTYQIMTTHNGWEYSIKQRYVGFDDKWTAWEDVFANVSYVDSINKKILDIIDSAPEALNTLNELATALNNDPDFAATVINQLESKVDKEDGKGLSTEDYTTSEKESVKYLSSYFKQIPEGKTINDLTEPGTYIGYEYDQYNGFDYTMPFILFVSNHNSLDEIDYAKICQMRIYCNPLSEIGDNIMQCRLYEYFGWTAWETIYATPQYVNEQIAQIPTGGGGGLDTTLKHLTTVVTTEDCTEITVDGLDVKSGVISGKLYKTGENAMTGFILGINGKLVTVYTGSSTNYVRFWIWKENGEYIGYASVGGTINTYKFTGVTGDITSVTAKNAYHANGGYYATGTTLELFEGVRPNVQ